MCLPYPHQECIALTGLSTSGLLFLLGIYTTGNAFISDPKEFDEGERGMGVIVGLTAIAVAVVVVIGTYTSAFPQQVTQLLTRLVEGLGYYLVLAYGPITAAVLTLGLGTISVAMTHLLLEDYV